MQAEDRTRRAAAGRAGAEPARAGDAFAAGDGVFPDVPPIRVRSVVPIALEAPLARPVNTPITPIRTAVGLLVIVEDEDGTQGCGEIWCNFPRFGNRHRARLVADVLGPALAQRSFASPVEAWSYMVAVSDPLRIQSGETGPIAAAIAGIDVALWDIAGKKVGQPLWRLFGGRRGAVPVYASLGRADAGPSSIERCLGDGFQAFKLRSSGTIDDHLGVVLPARAIVGDGCELMLDVNGSWDPEAAVATVDGLADARLSWLEEPIPVDAPETAWRRLAEHAPMPLAGGENMITPATFDAALAARTLAVLQPDLTKWGGFSGALPLARRIVAAGRRFCPHSFAGAPGLLASAHLLAASNSPDGILEYPIGRNPAREGLLDRPARDGVLVLGDAPGLGLDVDVRRLEPHRVAI